MPAKRYRVPYRGRRSANNPTRRKQIYPIDSALAISVVLPTHPNAAPLIERTLLTLSGQDFPASRFEVVVTVDGGDVTGALCDMIAKRTWPFKCRLVESPRPHGDIPHRNHTRNAGCAMAKGELIWPLDADFLLPPHTLSHIWSEFSDLLNSSIVAVLTPCMANVAIKPAKWLATSATALEHGDSTALLRCATEAPRHSSVVSGYRDRYRPGPADSSRIQTLNEGMPIIPSRVFSALGGFDEAFIGWGANKQELVRRLVGLAQSHLIEIRLLNSVLVLHQPHRADPDKRADSHRRRHNATLLARKEREIRRNARWWLVQKEQVRKSLVSWAKYSEATLLKPLSNHGTRVGIISVNDPRKGLYRDTEILIWALRKANEWFDSQHQISVFPVTGADLKLRRQADTAHAMKGNASLPNMAVSGTRFTTWLNSIDVMITCETWFDSAVRLARQRQKRVIFIPNLEWAAQGQPIEQWAEQIKNCDTEVWAKTKVTYEALHANGLDPKEISWSIPDKVTTHRTHRQGALNLLMLVGLGGWRNRRGLDTALRAFALARRQTPGLKLTVHSIKPIRDYPDMPEIEMNGLSVTEGLISRKQLDCLMENADAFLYPSRWEGFGLPLLEALHAGLPVLATDGAPMNELIEHGHNGLLVTAEATGSVRLAPSYECSPTALADTIVRLSHDTALQRRLTCPEPGELMARQYRFVNQVDTRVRDTVARRVVVFSAQPVAGNRRSESYWADALRFHGYEVTVLGHETTREQLRAQLERNVTFVLVGKIPHAKLRQIRKVCRAPLVLWHHDLTDYTSSRLHWFRQVAPECDLVAVPESDRGLVPHRAGRVVTLFPGAKVNSQRGPGRRPLMVRDTPLDNELLFLGRLTPQRVSLLCACAKVATVRIHGYADCPHPGLVISPPLWGQEAVRAMQHATYVLSSSVRNDIHYTSNRLFNSAGSGACVVVQRFPGIERLYPETSLALFNDPRDLPALLAQLRRDPIRQTELRLAAEEHTWQHHTWNDRVRILLGDISKLTSKDKIMLDNNTKITLTDYWNKRTRQRGAKAAGFHQWDDSTFKKQTAQVWQQIVDRIDGLAQGKPLRVLDFGCGPGRFSQRLAALGHTVIGVDISKEMLMIARQACSNPNCHFAQIEPGGKLPFDANYFDFLWTFTVLQHIPDTIFPVVISELQRVLSADSYICLLENTHHQSNRTSSSGHVVFRGQEEYLDAFPGLHALAQFDIERECHTLFFGRYTVVDNNYL